MGLIVRVNEAIGRHRNNHCEKEQLDLPPVIHAKGDGSEAKIGTKPQSLHSTTLRVACIHMGRVWFLFSSDECHHSISFNIQIQVVTLLDPTNQLIN
jgi:hypothetical protein